MDRDARVYRDRHGRGPRGVTAIPDTAAFTAALHRAIAQLDVDYPTSMASVTITVEDRPTAADLALAGDHVPAGRVLRGPTPEVTIFRVPLEGKVPGAKFDELVAKTLRALVEQAIGA